MTTDRHLKLGQQTTVISFVCGTVIFGFYFLTSSFQFLFIGYVFVILAGFINFIIFASILLRAVQDLENRKKLMRISGLMLINIPIMLVYCWVAIILLGTMRITFTNEIGTDLSDIKIIGCGGGHIKKLEKGESITVWVTITGDCSLYLDYLSNGKRKKETVAGYVTSNMGQKINHKISGKSMTDKFE